MQIASYTASGAASFGVVSGDGIVDAPSRTGFDDLHSVLTAHAVDQLTPLLDEQPDVAIDAVSLHPPVQGPGKIICVGVNYANRNEEYKDGQELPPYPSLFPRFADSFVGHDAALLRPPESEQLDYEGEIVLVVGKEGRRIAETEALDHVAGLTIMNEGTLRDWVRHAKFNVTQGKNFVASGSMGPWMVTSDEFASFDDLHLRTTVNGETRQDDTTANMIFPIPFLISYISTFTHLRPGDLISTGTPTGAGARFDPPIWLTPGDVVEVAVEGIGTLRNRVEDEPA